MRKHCNKFFENSKPEARSLTQFCLIRSVSIITCITLTNSYTDKHTHTNSCSRPDSDRTELNLIRAMNVTHVGNT